MTIQSSNLEEIQVFKDIFLPNTVVEYQFIISENDESVKGKANMVDFHFVKPQFYTIQFQTITLNISINNKNASLNPSGKLRTVKFTNADFSFDDKSQSFLEINNLNLLVFHKIQIRNQVINGEYSGIKIVNVTNVLISDLNMQNIEVLNQPLFQFQNVVNITFDNVNFTDSVMQNSIFEFIDCENISFKGSNNIYKIQIIQGQFFHSIKSNIIQLTNLNAQFFSQKIKIRRQLETNQQADKSNYLQSLLSFEGCYNVYIENVYLNKFTDTNILYTNHYSINETLYYFNYEITIKNMTLENSDFTSKQKNAFSIISQKIYLNYVNLTNTNSFSNIIVLNIQKYAEISNSFFTEINLQEGSALQMSQGQFKVEQTHFQNINSIGYPCALTIYQVDMIQINNSYFINLKNTEDTVFDKNKISYQQGGAINIQSTNQIKITNSLFQKCIAIKQGGALSQTQGNLFIEMSNFIQNESLEKSGGALFLSQLSKVNIQQSNFTQNQALYSTGGAISIDSSDIEDFKENNFISNQASIGGSIYYIRTTSEFFKKQAFDKNKISFISNKASFFGQNIGSVPYQIGISKYPEVNSLQVYQQFEIENISSGNYLDYNLYVNLIDEENNPFNFKGQEQYYDKSSFQFQLYTLNNSQVIIQQGTSTKLNNSIGLFELNFQSIYKTSQKQVIYLNSSEFEQSTPLSVKLNLNYRNCTAGEIVQETDQFMLCKKCVEGRYSLVVPDMVKDSNQLQCYSCPEQAYFCEGSQIKLKDGYWRANNQTDQIYECILDSCSFDNPKSQKGCLTGFVGPICNSCDNKQSVWGEQYGFQNTFCYPCRGQTGQIYYVCFFITVYVAYLSLSQNNMMQSKIRNIKLRLFQQIGLIVTSKLSSSGNQISLQYKILIHYLQILALSAFFGVFKINAFTLPVNLFGDPASITVTSFDCLFKIDDQYPVWLNRILAQILSIIAIYIFTIIIFVAAMMKKSKDKMQNLKKIPQIARMTIVYIYIFYQPSIVINII